ncbi:MAG: hypothetical protein L0387_10595 [Acidobacteria bacterium]|nr:hypothetical protein [Acidobacteriota bacterium]
MKLLGIVLFVVLCSTGAVAAPQSPQVEQDAFLSAMQESDVGARINALETFLKNYPASRLKDFVRETLNSLYWQTVKLDKVEAISHQMLVEHPEDVVALTSLAALRRVQAQGGVNPASNFAEGKKLAERALLALPRATKPPWLSDADFSKAQAQRKWILDGVVGIAALAVNDHRTAQQRLRAAVQANPSNKDDVCALTLAYLGAESPDMDNGLWFLGRCANLVGEAAKRDQVLKSGRKIYKAYHGSERGWMELVASTERATSPPPNFKIEPRPMKRGDTVAGVATLIAIGLAAYAFSQGLDFPSAWGPESERKLMLFGGPEHRVYLGCLNCAEYEPDSVLNPAGRYGSPFHEPSIWNRFGAYGSQFSEYSACNQFAGDPPVIVDEGGKFYGRVSLNLNHSQLGVGLQLHAWLKATVCKM